MEDEYKNEPPKHMREKERNSTKFEQCGWCEYATGSHRYAYCISGTCDLLKDYGENEVKWDTPCRLKGMSKSEFINLKEYHQYRAKNYRSSADRQDDYANVLGGMVTEAPSRPPLPDHRKHDHFSVGDPLAVFFDGEHCTDELVKELADKNLKLDSWFFGEVKIGYRHQDGCVSFRLEGVGPQDGNDSEFPYKGGFWGSGMSVPHVMLREEYDWFLGHPEEYEEWCRRGYEKKYNGKELKRAPLNAAEA